MGNEQSSSSSGRLQSPTTTTSQRRRSMSSRSTPTSSNARSSRNVNKDEPPPPPYVAVDEASADVRRAQTTVGRQSQAQLDVPGGGSSHRRSNSASRAQAPTFSPPSSAPPLVGGFRIDVAQQGQASSLLPSTNPFVAPSPTTPTFAPPPGPPPGSSNSPGRGANIQRRNTTEDLLDLLRKYNTIIIVDDSSSMAGRRWRETRAALAGLAGIASQYDVDGVDIHFLNSPVVGDNMKSTAAVEALFDSIDPDGITPTGEKLEILLLDYLLQIEDAQDKDREEARTRSGRGGHLKAIKPVNYIILTDGAPTDDPESVIITAAKRLDARHFPLSQVGIQFVQIGDDAKAAEALKELDDALAGEHGIRDMVDTTLYSPDRGELSPRDIAKILLGGINRRIDKRGAE